MNRHFSFSILLMLLLFAYGASHPAMNWDIIGYTASVFYNDGVHNSELRDRTYSDVRSIASPSTFNELTSGTEYRSIVYTDDHALEQHMPFYTIRMGYVWAVSFTAKIFNVTGAEATYLVSSFFAGLCILVLGFLFRLTNFWLLLGFLLAIGFAGFGEIATLSTPDSMATFFALASWVLYIRKSSWTVVPLVILPLIRTDYILLPGILFLFALSEKKILRAFVFFAPAAVIYILVNRLNSNYGYLKIFNFTLINLNPLPAEMPIETDVGVYIRAYTQGFKSFIGHKHFIAYLAYGVYWFKIIRPKNIQSANQQVYLVLGFTLLHMLLFPAYYQRFFSWCAAIAFLQVIFWVYDDREKAKVTFGKWIKL